MKIQENKSKRVLMLASVSSMIDQFNMSNIKLLEDLNYQVDVACNFTFGNTSSKQRIARFKQELEERKINCYQIDFARDMSRIKENIRAYNQVKQLLLTREGTPKYSFIHCHSPIGGVIGRLAAHKTNTIVIYTAHGFHFFKGSPYKSWLFFYPVEKFLSRWTDCLITINQEDKQLADKKFHAKEVDYIPGVGIDIEEIADTKNSRKQKRQEIGVSSDSIICISVGELNVRKNHEIPIKALAKLNNPNIYYIICGKGNLEKYLKNLCEKLNLQDHILFLEFREDIIELCKASDIYIFPSRREGLGIAALEGMAAGLPLISSYVHGIKDYTEDGKTGFCLNPFDIDGFANAIEILAGDRKLCNSMGAYNLKAVQKYSIKNTEKIMKTIYMQF